MGYETLNYLHDGTELPYFQRKEETEQKENEQKSNSNNNKNNDNKSQQNGGDNKSQNKNGAKSNGSASNKQSQSQSSSQKLKGGPSDSNKVNGGNNNEQKSDSNVNNNGNEEERLSFDNIPLIIFSKTGESHIIDVQLKELGNKLREGLISVDRSLDDNVANLNKGTPDTTIRPIYISYANDLIAYRFSANDLNRQFRAKKIKYVLYSECKDNH